MIIIFLSLKLTVIIIEFVNTEENQNNPRNTTHFTSKSTDLNNYTYDDSKSSIRKKQSHVNKNTNSSEKYPDTKNIMEHIGASINVINNVKQTKGIDTVNNEIIYGVPFHSNESLKHLKEEYYQRNKQKIFDNIITNRSRVSKICENGCLTSWKPISEIQYPNSSYIDKNTTHLKYISSVDMTGIDAIRNTFRNSEINDQNVGENNKNEKYIIDNMRYTTERSLKYYEQPHERNKKTQKPIWNDEPVDIRFTENKIHLNKPSHDNNMISNYNKNTLGRKIYPEDYYSDDYHGRWYDNSYGWHSFKDLHYCRKYCHCCRDHTSYYHGFLDKFRHFFKYFSFNNDYDYHKRSSFDTKPWTYLKNLHRRYGDYYYDDNYHRHHHDDEFVYFDDIHGEPDHVTDCKDLCSCCHSDVIFKFKKKISSFKWHRLNKRKLHGLFGLIKNLVFTKSEECEDCGEDKNGRSLEERYDYAQDWHEGEHYPFYESYNHDHDLYHHHHDYNYLQWFDCSRCCRYCRRSTIKVVKVYEKGKRKKRQKFHRKRLLEIIKRFIRRKFGYEDNDDEDEDDEDEDENDDDDEEDRNKNRRRDSERCCGNLTGGKVLIILALIAVIIIQCFSPINILIIVLVPVFAFGSIMILMFFLLHAVVPLYFTPILGVVFIIIGAPVLLTAFGFFISLPVTLSPVFLPFALNASPEIIYNFPNITYPNLPVNFTTGTIPPLTTEPTTNKHNFLPLGNTEDIKSSENMSINTAIIQMGGQETTDNFFSRIHSFFGSKSCLERIGCHMAVLTNWLHVYNGFILRILDNLSSSVKDTSSKFIVYKEAYRIGSISTTNHAKCSKLYYCKTLS